MSSNTDSANNSESDHSFANNKNIEVNSKQNKNTTIPAATLKIAEVAEQRDVGRKIARIDPNIAE
jgi:hypothetical protein